MLSVVLEIETDYLEYAVIITLFPNLPINPYKYSSIIFFKSVFGEAK